jgi:hypothetical protein
MMRQRYSTNLATIPTRHYPYPPFRACGWHVTFGSYFHDPRSQTHLNGRIRVPRRIVIHARTQTGAQNAVGLITAARCLADASCGDDPNFDRGVAYLGQTLRRSRQDQLEDDIPSVQEAEYHLPILIATRASFRKRYQYALYKYKLSQQAFPTYVRDLEPSRWNTGRAVFVAAEHHVHCSQAIILAYSVLEELGLEMRATAQVPSFVNGVWNPIVRNDLEHRLEVAGIDLSETALWTIRDTPTRIERSRVIPVIRRAEWAHGRVRDSEMELVDAIAQASWLRSRVSAHRLHTLSSSLTYYDVSNLHYLARRLLRESLGLWRYPVFPD